MPAPAGAVMDGPWTDYAAAPAPSPQDGPWSDYKPQSAAPAQVEVPPPPSRPKTPPQDSISAYEPSLLEQTRDAFANSAIGRSVQSTMPKVAGALNLRPSESLASPTYRQHGEQLVAPEYLAPALGEAIGSRKTGQPAQANTAGQNRLEGSLEELGSLTDKTNLALGVGTAAAGGLTAGFINPFSARLLSRLIGAGFSLQMLQSLYRQHKGYRQAVDSGDLARAQQIQGAMGVTGVLALLSGAHAARGGGEPAGVPAEQPAAANGPWNDYAADTTRTFTAAANKEGRPIVQGSSDADAIRASAAEQQPTLKATIQGAVAGVPGAEVDGSRVKEAESQQNKADRGKPIETQSDHLGVRIAADTPAAAAQAETAIAKDHTITSTEPLTTNGLEGTQVMVQSGKPGDANQVSEVQILPTAQVKAMEETEPLYEKEKKALADGNDAQAERLAEEAKAIHQDALHPEKEEPKYKFGSTQVNLPPSSDAAHAIGDMQSRISEEDLAGDGKDIDKAHVTVRYGLKNGITPQLRAFIESQSPFEAHLGKTASFPPSESSGGAAPVIAPVESPELHKINAEIEKHGDFEPSSFPDYKPHVTVAYVKPEAAPKYTGLADSSGKGFPVQSIAVSDRMGMHTEIELKGGNEKAQPASSTQTKGESGKTPEPANVTAGETPAVAPLKLAKGSAVALDDGRTGTINFYPWDPKGRARLTLADGSRLPSVPVDKLTPIPSPESTGGKWIGVDLDGTLAHFDSFKGASVIGAPIPAMIDRVKQWLSEGKDVRIFTARVTEDATGVARKAIQQWSEQKIGRRLPITNMKDRHMEQLWDDRAVQVERNTGEQLGNPENTVQPQAEPAPAADSSSESAAASTGEAAPATTGGEAEPAAAEPSSRTGEGMGNRLAPGAVGRAKVSELQVDPKRFQYKLNTDAGGATKKLKDVQWNDTLSGIVTAWRDPESGVDYVVNGHHRIDLAMRHGVDELAVRMLPEDVNTAARARTVGALQNIAEGQGTAVDAAKFLRDTGLTSADLSRYGISLSGPVAEGGTALAQLDQRLFDDVVAGRLPERRGIAIARAADTPERQDALVKLIDRAEAKGRTVTNATIEEMGRMVKGAGERTATEDTLFGKQQRTENLALEKAEVSAFLRNQIAQEKKLFAGLSSTSKAEKVGEVGKNRIDAEENKKVATLAEQAQETYDRLSTKRGPVDDILNLAAKRIAEGENANTVKSEAYRSIRTAISEALPGREESSAGRVQEDAKRPEEAAAAEPAKPPTKEVEAKEPALPGLESAVIEQKESAAELKSETEKTTAEQTLTSPKADISRAAGEMERDSPLFHGTGAGGNRTLFEGKVEPDEEVTQQASDLGARLFSGFADPELFRRLFPDVAKRVDAWVRDEPTEGTTQRAMMRQTRGEMDRRVAGAMQKLSGAMREWRSRPREDSIAFWNAVESGETDSLPAKDRVLADTFKGAFDQMKQEIQQLKPEVLRNYIENYFPHLWEGPSVVGDAMRAILTGKRPFAGKASFLKQRTIPTMQDGLNLGFKPKTWNPVESFLLKYSEMAQFLMGHQTLAMMKEAGTARFVGIGQKSPVGWTQIDDRIGTVYGNPDIPVTEYFDKQVWAALQQTARNMLVETTRKMNIGGTRLGYYSLLDGIVTKTATPLDTLAHELGHAIDEAYGLKEKLVKDKQFKQELRDLADLRFEGEDSPSPYYKKYVRKGEEKMAAIFQAYVHTPERLQEVAPNTFRHIREFLGEHEELEPLLNLKRGLTYKARQDSVYAGGIVTTGHYYAPAEAARVFNNYVSRGMAGRSGVYDVLNWTNQNLNALQLGVSAFHAATTTINAATSDVALGLQQLAEGKPFKAGASISKGATIVPSLVSTVRNGGRLMKEYLDPGSYEKFEAEADAMAEAGGRIRQNVIEIKPLDRVINAWRNGAATEGLTHLPAALLDASVRPVMEYYVPRMKLGAFYAMAHDILEQAGKSEWSPEEVRSRMQKAWDSVDNRFGQMVYDNLFWHKGVRDALQLATRSVGWNFGDLRELGGAATDTVREGAKAMGGEMPELTPRMAFGLALPMVSALLGGVLTYLWTGRKPDTWKDYFYPKTADGTRHSIPGYMKDVFAFVHAPVQTTLNKLGPVWEMSAEAINNRDFYGTEIRHSDDPMIHQLGQFAAWAGKEAIPFSFSSGAKLLEQRGAEPTLASMIEHTKKNPGDLILGQLGFQQAPGFMQNSAAMNKALEYGREDRPPGTKTKQESDHSRAYQAVVKMYRSGKIDRQQVDRYRKEGLLPGPSIARAAMDARYPPIVLASRSLHLEQFLNVYAVASPAEQEQLRPLLATKGRQLEQIPEGPQRDKVLEAYERAISVKTSGPLRASTHP